MIQTRHLSCIIPKVSSLLFIALVDDISCLLDIFLFTLYWTLIMYAATYGLCGLWAAIINFRSAHRKGRSPMPALLLLLLFLSFGTFSAVLGSAVVGQWLLTIFQIAL